MPLTTKEIEEQLLKRYEGLAPQNTWGETSYFYNPGNKLSRGAYFMTIKEKDGENDKASKLDREGVFRINCGTTKSDFMKLFGEKPARPPKGGVVEGPWDFTERDTIMPHPVYGWAGWICVLNPSEKTLNNFFKIADDYYDEAVVRFNKRISKN